MSIKYLCFDCAKLLDVRNRLSAVNEVGRKHCEGCGWNRDNLVVIDADECDSKIAEWNRAHKDGDN